MNTITYGHKVAGVVIDEPVPAYMVAKAYLAKSYLCKHTIFIYWCMSLIASSFTRERAREAYVNSMYSMFLCSWFSMEKVCASLREYLI